MSPAKSKAQQRLIGAAEHGASFPLARAIQGAMTQQQMHDFASGSMKGKPTHVPQPKPSASFPHRNLGAYLHAPRKKGK